MKVSIIIPTIGRKTLPTVLKSILSADDFSFEKVEILVVGDGDFSREFILGSDSDFFRITYLSTGKNIGSSGARNLALDQAQGEIISFLGDDTMVHPKWLAENIRFHTKNPAKNLAMLGQINWSDEFKDDRFYKWLNNYAQFAYRSIRLHGAKWRHFYTSNVSLKRDFIDKERFFAGFSGWGFEDSELGYRLYKKGMNLIYNPKCIVYHDHEQSIDSICANFKKARKNAQLFERLHPEISILPTKNKLKVLKQIIKVAKFFAPIIPEAEWWYKWKEAWIEIVKD